MRWKRKIGEQGRTELCLKRTNQSAPIRGEAKQYIYNKTDRAVQGYFLAAYIMDRDVIFQSYPSETYMGIRK